jgi:hypothetical protein
MSRSSTSQYALAAAMAFELVLVVALVAIFTSAYADVFGAAAPWGAPTRHSAALYNVCISVLALVLWCVRVGIRGRGLDVYGAVAANAMYDVLLALLWTYSAVLQHSGDATETKHGGLQPWCLGKSGRRNQNQVVCGGAARASFGLAVVAG